MNSAFDDDGFTREGQMAMEGDRNASIAMWERVARGEFDLETQTWLQHVAQGVLDAESKDAGRLRDSAIIRALGIANKIDKHRAVREFAQVAKLFSKKINPRGDLIQQVRNSFPNMFVDLSDIELGKLIDRELKKPS